MRELKLASLKKLKGNLKKNSAKKVKDACKSNSNRSADLTSSIEPTYPGFKNPFK